MAKDNPLFPLLILAIIITVLAIIGYVAYSIVQDVTDVTRSKMEKKNVLFTKDGVKVGVRHVGEEDIRDRTQSVLVNMWNHTSFPAYKSRIWNMAGTAAGAVTETANKVATATGATATAAAGSVREEDGHVERRQWSGRKTEN